MNERIDDYHYIAGYHDGFQGFKKKSAHKQVEQYQKGYEDGMTDRSYYIVDEEYLKAEANATNELLGALLKLS